MHTVAEIEAAAKSLPQQQQEELLRRLEDLLHTRKSQNFPVIPATGRSISQQELDDARDDD
jgi:hypothetical protein